MNFKKHYIIGDNPDTDDKLSINIQKNKRAIYNNIKSFISQIENNGVFAENILRLVLDGVNLNHLSKNHPHVDIAIIDAIDGITKNNEIISVKSSIRAKTIRGAIGDTKAIKLESFLDYLIYGINNFNIDYSLKHFKPKKLLKDLEKIKEIKNIDINRAIKRAIYTTLYYIIFKNEKQEEINLLSDLNEIIKSDEIIDTEITLNHGTFREYEGHVFSKIRQLEYPISLGLIYPVINRDGTKEPCIIIKKSNSIKISECWDKLIQLWIEGGYFIKNKKYLSSEYVYKLFGVAEKDFPIEIKISIPNNWTPISRHNIDTMSDSEKLDYYRKAARDKTKKLYIATKFKDYDFGDQQSNVNNFFVKTLNKLNEDPKSIKKFNDFVDEL